MLQEVKAEIFELGCDFIFARNLSLTILLAIAVLCGLAELQSQSIQLTEQNSITNMSNSSSTKVIIDRR